MRYACGYNACLHAGTCCMLVLACMQHAFLVAAAAVAAENASGHQHTKVMLVWCLRVWLNASGAAQVVLPVDLQPLATTCVCLEACCKQQCQPCVHGKVRCEMLVSRIAAKRWLRPVAACAGQQSSDNFGACPGAGRRCGVWPSTRTPLHGEWFEVVPAVSLGHVDGNRKVGVAAQQMWCYTRRAYAHAFSTWMVLACGYLLHLHC